MPVTRSKEGVKSMKIEPANGGMRPLTRDQIQKLVHRREQKSFKLPSNFDLIRWDEIEFLTWKHPSGHKAYLLESETGEPRLWVLECDPKPQRIKATMCSLCFSVQSGQRIQSFSYRPEQNRNKILGTHFCADLGCVQNVTKVYPDSMRETLTPAQKRQRMLEKLHVILATWEAYS